MKSNPIVYMGYTATSLVFRTFYTREGNMACGAAAAAFAGLKSLLNS